MRRGIGAALACAAVLGIWAPAAAADIVHEVVSRCEADMTWQIVGDRANPMAEVTYDTGVATNSGCKVMHAGVEEDLDPFVVPGDTGMAGTDTFRLRDVWTDGDFVFAGTATEEGGGGAVHRGTGPCGPSCFKTHTIWTAAVSADA
jgi:hypothetical protein